MHRMQVWDRNVNRLVHVWTIPESQMPPPTSAAGPFVRGAAINIAPNGAPHICFGTSNGTLWVWADSRAAAAASCVLSAQGTTSMGAVSDHLLPMHCRFDSST